MSTATSLSNTSLLIAQEVTCYYPISDIYSPTPRYLFYCLLALSFITASHGWVAHIIFGAAVSYAATASIEAFILLTAQFGSNTAEPVSIPFLSLSTLPPSLSSSTPGIMLNETYVDVQPDYLELDVDAVTSIVVTAYLVGLPLQCWSSTGRTRRILHWLILLWNMMMLAGSISALVLWPNLNVSPPQYRFCYAGVYDSSTVQSTGWDPEFFSGSWNETIWNLFDGPLTNNNLWFELPTNCFYPCFNTSQVMRESTRLRATVFGTEESGDGVSVNLHTWSFYRNDEFQPLIYSALAVFTAAQLYLLIVGRLGLCTSRVPIYKPINLWFERKEIVRSLYADLRAGRSSLSKIAHHPSSLFSAIKRIHTLHRHPIFHFLIDTTTIAVLIAVMFLGPLTIIAFIVWIEQYIHSDGEPNETIEAVGQWQFIVQIGIVLIAAVILRLRYVVAPEEEIQRDIVRARKHLEYLEKVSEKKQARSHGITSDGEKSHPGTSWSAWFKGRAKGTLLRRKTTRHQHDQDHADDEESMAMDAQKTAAQAKTEMGTETRTDLSNSSGPILHDAEAGTSPDPGTGTGTGVVSATSPIEARGDRAV